MGSLLSAHSARRFNYYRNKLIQDIIEQGLTTSVPFADLIVSCSEGKSISKEDTNTIKDCHPCILYFELFKYGCRIDEVKTFINPEILKAVQFCEYGDLLISNSGFDINRIGIANAYLCPYNSIVSDHTWVIKHKQDSRFLAYLFGTKHIRNQILKLEKPGVSAIHIYTPELRKLLIPLPNLSVQQRIANELDLLWKTLDPEVKEQVNV